MKQQRYLLDTNGSEKARLRINGTPLEDDFDLLIGCTAVTEGMILVTENVKDFKNIKVSKKSLPE